MNMKTINHIRKVWGINEDKRDAGLNKHPNGITRYDNIQYDSRYKEDILDVYRPTKISTQKLPLIINIHGGAYIYSSKKRYQFYLMKFAKHGFATVNFNYRLAPEHPFPAAWDDMKAVLKWCVKNVDKYKFDLTHVFIIGDSSGANLAEQLLTLYSNYKIAKEFHFKMPKIRIVGGILNCGLFFLSRTENLARINKLFKTYYTKSVSHKYHNFIHIDNYINSKFPPVFLATATNDFWMLPQNTRMDQLMIDRHVRHTLKVYPNTNDWGHDFQLNLKNPVAINCINDEIKFCKNIELP